MSEKQLTLPVDTPEDKGCWRTDGSGARFGVWERRLLCLLELVSSTFGQCPQKLDTEHHFTFIFSTSHLDWNEWAAVNVPGVGQLDLEQFWGKQGLAVTFCDDGGCGADKRR
eukprot:4916290-Amphidinium_carterae.2